MGAGDRTGRHQGGIVASNRAARPLAAATAVRPRRKKLFGSLDKVFRAVLALFIKVIGALGLKLHADFSRG